MEPIREGTRNLPDGRRLGWAQWGRADGTPVLLFHGNPGSRRYVFDGGVLAELGVLLTTVDRPGIGESTPRPGRRFVDWPDDVRELVDALGLERFAIYGHSMGGPHALACGARLPDRISRVAVSGSPGPWDEPAFADLPPPQIRTVRERFGHQSREEAEREYRADLEAQRRVLLDDLDEPISQLSEPDRLLFRDPAHRAIAVPAIEEAMRPGIEGFFEERMAGYVDPWGFELREVVVPVLVFHGDEDEWVPPEVGRALARHLPHATYHEFRGVGHFLAPEQQRVVLRRLIEEPATQPTAGPVERPEGTR